MSQRAAGKLDAHTAFDKFANQEWGLARSRSEHALRLVCANLPWLSGLAYAVTLHVDDRIPVAAVSATGRVLVNPKCFAVLPLNQATFVLAHELLHLALDTFRRQSELDDPATVNRAHDYIINDILRHELRMSPPLSGLDLLGASEKSLEKIMAWMNQNKSAVPQSCWEWDEAGTVSRPDTDIMSRALRDAGLLPPLGSTLRRSDHADSSSLESLDVISAQLELELFPESEENSSTKSEAAKRVRNHQIEHVRRAAAKALSLREVSHAVEQQRLRGIASGNCENLVEALRGCYQTPWQMALQRWLEAVAPGQRTYTRATRRGTSRSGCVLPGRLREGWTLHLILDTSGSMSSELAYALGAIAEFSASSGVAEVHILQCDVEVTVDEWIPIEGLDSYRIAGYGGSDMSPAMVRLANDPEVVAVVVVTDGCIDYPQVSPPCLVLWVITGPWEFHPPYGEVLKLTKPE